MLTMAIPDVEFRQFARSQNGFNLSTRWNQRLWFYGSTGGEFEEIGLALGEESSQIVFLWGHFLYTCSDTFAVGCIV